MPGIPADTVVPFLPIVRWAPRVPTETLEKPSLPMLILMPGRILMDLRNLHPMKLPPFLFAKMVLHRVRVVVVPCKHGCIEIISCWNVVDIHPGIISFAFWYHDFQNIAVSDESISLIVLIRPVVRKRNPYTVNREKWSDNHIWIKGTTKSVYGYEKDAPFIFHNR